MAVPALTMLSGVASSRTRASFEDNYMHTQMRRVSSRRCVELLRNRRSGYRRIERRFRGQTAKAERSDFDSELRIRAPNAEEERAPGDVVAGGYTVVRMLGEGANGTTYEAQTGDGVRVAVKELALRRLKDWKQFDLFEREAAMLKSLNHPSIPRYIDYVESSGEYFLVQELAEGRTLADVVADPSARFDEAEVERIARSLLQTVDYLSSRRPPVVHRDIKPENIVLEGGRVGGRVLLVDFGGVQDALSLSADQFGSTIVGTAGYMAPEALRGNATPASDMYSLGAVLLFALSGRRPQQFGSRRLRLQFEDEVVMGPKMRRLLQRLLDPIPEDRCTPQQALDILDGKEADETDREDSRNGGWLGRADTDRRAEGVAGLASTRDGGAVPFGQSDFGRLPYPPPFVPLFGAVSRPWRQAPTSKPSDSRVVVSTSDDLLMVEVPPGGLNGQSIGTGAFAAVWNILIATWTFSALVGGGVLFALFSVPFWLAGTRLVRDTLMAALLKESLQVDASRWSISQELAQLNKGVATFVGRNLATAEGRTSDLSGCRVIVTMIVNEEPRTAIELVAGASTYRFGESLQVDEQEWLVGTINRHIERVAGAVDVENDLVPRSVPVINDRDRGRRFGDSWDD